MHSFIIAITTFTAYLLILTIDIVPYQLENHLLIVILSIESIVSIHSLQLYCLHCMLILPAVAFSAEGTWNEMQFLYHKCHLHRSVKMFKHFPSDY